MANIHTTLKLTETDTKSYQDEKLIQHNAKKQFMEKIEIFIDDISNHSKTEKSCNEKKDFIERVHNTILINGKRGMGKTSFILSMEHNENEHICNLGIIDPTMIESKEHIFLHIISLIKTKIVDNYNESCLSDWTKILKNLAGGLNVLDGIGSNHLHDELWDSPELILEKGLSNSKHGYTLEKNFHRFIQESLKILDKKAFFLILDDIDTSLDKGRDILETLRKYLTSKQLIIAMLGDIDLYSILVRQLQWEKMDPNKTLKEYEGQENYLTQIEHLEEQYLTKVLKPENRIDLETLLSLESNIEIINNDNPISLEKFMEELIKNIYLTDNNYSQYYKKLLLTQSTRSILQILQAYGKTNLEGSKITAYITRFKHTFYSTLKKKLSKYNLIEVPARDDFLNLLSIYVLKSPINRDNHLKLIPTFFDEDDNIATMHLNSMANHLLEPKDYLSYFIKIGYALERYRSLDIRDENEHQRFVEHIGLNDKSCSKIARKILTTFPIGTTTHTNNPIFFGNVSVSTSQIKSIKNGENLALVYSSVRNPKGGSYGVFSFFNLLGLLADLSTRNEEDKENYFWSKQDLLREFYTYNEAISSGDKITEQDNSIEDFDITPELKEQLTNWSKKVDKINTKLPLYVLAKIWIRVVYTFADIEGRSQNKTKTYLKLFELYVVGFLNAVYVEIALHKKEKVDIKNPSTDASYFYKKLQNYKKDSEKYSLFDYLCECPIFSCENEYILTTFPALNSLSIDRSSFKVLGDTEQKEIIMKIDEWEQKEPKEIQDELINRDYSQVWIATIKKLIKEMKQN